MTDYWIDNVRIENSYTYDNNWVNGSKTDLVAVHVVAGKISAIISQDEFVKENMQATYSGDGLLMLPSLTDKHVHLDKLKIGEPWTPIRPAKNIVERFEQEIPDINRLSSSMQERAEKMIALEKQHGVTTIRSHVDIEPMTDLRHFKEIKKVAENSDIKIEIVAFPQHGLLRSQSYDLVAQALQSGAKFMLGPQAFTKDIYELAQKSGVITVPGAMSPTEIQTEFSKGADIVKVFPAITVGSKFFKQLSGPMAGLRLMAVGGVNIDNAKEFMTAGAGYLGIGSSFFKKQDLNNLDEAALNESIQNFLTEINM